MKAMILAAGRGERMRPLTDTTPKPLLEVSGKSLIEYHLFALASAGFTDVVINICYFPEQFITRLGQGERYGVNIQYSVETGEPLETGGGILNALPLLGEGHFLVLNADIWTDYPLSQLPKTLKSLAHLVLVDNPPHNPKGDYFLQGGLVSKTGHEPRLTYAGINIYHTSLFAECQPGRFRLPSILEKPIQAGLVTGEHYKGKWMDIGTIERLKNLEIEIQRDICKVRS